MYVRSGFMKVTDEITISENWSNIDNAKYISSSQINKYKRKFDYDYRYFSDKRFYKRYVIM